MRSIAMFECMLSCGLGFRETATLVGSCVVESLFKGARILYPPLSSAIEGEALASLEACDTLNGNILEAYMLEKSCSLKAKPALPF